MNSLRHKSRQILVVLLMTFAGLAGTAYAQSRTQSIDLKPGWNAVFLEVNPSPNDCESVFSGLPIESVWAWNRRFETVQFVENANELTVSDPEWLVYFGERSADSAASTLFAIHSRPLLIKLAGSSSVSWTVSGTTSISPPKWISNAFNLVGFSLDEKSLPTLHEFLSQDAALAGQPIHQLSNNGRWERVESPASTIMQSGEAYWIYCDGTSTFSGGIKITTETGGGLFFGRTLVEQVLTLKNETGVARTVTLKAVPSLLAQTTGTTVAGAIPLNYWRFDGVGKWEDLGAGQSIEIPEGGEARIRLEAVRPAGGGIYQNLLQIADDKGLLYHVPVSADGIAGNGTKGTGDHPRAGLWIGTVSLNMVNFVTAPTETDRNALLDTASDFQFRVLIHVDAAGTPRFLQEVIQMWKPGTMNPDGTVESPGEFVLLTNDSRISEFEGSTLRDGTPAGRRFSTAAFGFRDPITMTGEFPTPTTPESSIGCEVVLPYDDPVNPFYHRYHPDHDNLNFQFKPFTGEPEQESFTITRTLTLEFSADDPDDLAIAGWGDTQIGGTYAETLAGLYKSTELIRVSGTFRLQLASSIDELNPDL